MEPIRARDAMIPPAVSKNVCRKHDLKCTWICENYNGDSCVISAPVDENDFENAMLLDNYEKNM